MAVPTLVALSAVAWASIPATAQDPAPTAQGAVSVVERYLTGGDPFDNEAFERLCEANPDGAREAVRAYLEAHRGQVIGSTQDLFAITLRRLLGGEIAAEYLAHHYVARVGCGHEAAEYWLRRVVMQAKETPWRPLYDCRAATSYPDLLRLIHHYLHRAVPVTEDVESVAAEAPMDRAICATAWAHLASAARTAGEEDRERAYAARAVGERTAALTSAPESAEVQVEAAWVSYWLGDYEGALTYLDEAVRIEPLNLDAWLLKRDVCLRLKRQGDADAAAAKITEAEAALAEERLRAPWGLPEGRARAEGRVGSFLDGRARQEATDEGLSEAFDALDDILRIHPEEHFALLARGLLRQELGESADALADYDALAAAMPDGSYVQLLRSEALRALGRREEADAALAAYRTALGVFVLPVLPDAADLQSPMPSPQDGREVMASPGEPAVELARTLLTETDRPQEFLAAARALQDLDGARLAPAVGLLERATLVPGLDGPQKVALFGLLARAKSLSSVPYLVKAILDDPAGDPLPRTVALRALTGFPGEDRIPVLLAVLLSTDDEDLRRGVRSALQDRDGAEDTAIVWTDMLLRGPREVQVEAAQRVAGYGLGLLVLVEIARDDGTDPAVRRQAIDAIARQHAEIAESLGK